MSIFLQIQEFLNAHLPLVIGATLVRKGGAANDEVLPTY